MVKRALNRASKEGTPSLPRQPQSSPPSPCRPFTLPTSTKQSKNVPSTKRSNVSSISKLLLDASAFLCGGLIPVLAANGGGFAPTPPRETDTPDLSNPPAVPSEPPVPPDPSGPPGPQLPHKTHAPARTTTPRPSLTNAAPHLLRLTPHLLHCKLHLGVLVRGFPPKHTGSCRFPCTSPPSNPVPVHPKHISSFVRRNHLALTPIDHRLARYLHLTVADCLDPARVDEQQLRGEHLGQAFLGPRGDSRAPPSASH